MTVVGVVDTEFTLRGDFGHLTVTLPTGSIREIEIPVCVCVCVCVCCVCVRERDNEQIPVKVFAGDVVL